MLEIILLIVGLALILCGASVMTDGASNLAKKFGISEFVVGLTVVAIGTSAPELIVTTMSALKGNGDVAVGNVVGSNIFNTLLILGIVALIKPLEFTRNNIKKDIPYGVVASLVLFFVASDSLFGEGINIVSRTEGMTLIVMFLMFMAYTIYSSKPDPADPSNTKAKNTFMLIGMTVAGLVMLVFGGNMFLDNAIIVAERAGISQKVIAITLMSGGTSFPELAACVVAAVKKRGNMALGNVIGSNISNIFLIIGTGATITPLTLGDIQPYDLLFVLGSSFIVFVSAFLFKGFKINRIEGAIFVALYVFYIVSIL
ncbi:MAG: calcium/sodium antiporter [Rikenellaceae bacterium]